MADLPVLYVEPNENDAILLRNCFKRVGVEHPFVLVDSGEKALDYLSGKEPYNDRAQYPFPCLMLLEIRLSLMPGADVLRWIRSSKSPELQTLPVIIFTGCDFPGAIERAYKLGANAYVQKLMNHEEWTERARVIKDFWFIHNTPPRKCPQAPLSQKDSL